MPRNQMVKLRAGTAAQWAAADALAAPGFAVAASETVMVDNDIVKGTGAATVAALSRVGSLTYVQVGQTGVSVDGAYGGDIAAALAASPTGSRLHLGKASYSPTGDLTIGTGTILEGPGSGDCVIHLADGKRIVTAGFDALTGTNPTSGGAGQFALRGLSVDGGIGVRIYGYAYEINDLIVRNSTAVGFYSEWTNADSPIPANASMEARVKGLKSHHNASHGVHFNGPHDSILTDIFGYFNTSGSGIILDAKGAGTHLVNGHAYGVTHDYAMKMLGSGQQVTNTQAEGATVAQLLILAGDSQFQGRVFSAAGNENVAGIVIGQAGNVGAGLNIRANIGECRAGAIDWTYDGGGSLYDLTVNQSSGNIYVGTFPANSRASMRLLGGITLGGWSDPWILGGEHHQGAIYTQSVISAVNDAARLEGAGQGGVLALANTAGTAPANPPAGGWKLYLTTGTTGGTAKLVARGASGTVTTILDNIPA